MDKFNEVSHRVGAGVFIDDVDGELFVTAIDPVTGIRQ